MARRQTDRLSQNVMLGASGLIVLAIAVLVFVFARGRGPSLAARAPQTRAVATAPMAASGAAATPTAQALPSPSGGVTPVERPLIVRSDDLRQQYAGDASAADQKYKDKLLDVTGVVTMVYREPPLIGIGFGQLNDQAPPILCDMDPQQTGQLSQVRPGQTLTLRGRGLSMVQGGFIGVGKCRIVTPGR